jgi:hypothetical protein
MQVRNAQKGGAVAAIIYNDGPEDALPSMELPPDSEEPEIPSAIISIRAANEIFELMKAHPGGGVKARMRGRRATVFVPGVSDSSGDWRAGAAQTGTEGGAIVWRSSGVVLF